MKYSSLLAAATLLTTLILSTSCMQKRDYIPMSKDSLKGSGKLFLVPFDDFPAEITSELASFYRDKHQLEVDILPSVPLSQEAINQEREQLIAEEAVEIMKRANPKLQKDSAAILIGLTNKDMYIAKYDWRFSFSWRQEGKYAVVSRARMHLPNGDREITEDVIMTRLRKMVTKNVGILCFRLAQNDEPRSVLYRNVGGIRELDYMGEDF